MLWTHSLDKPCPLLSLWRSLCLPRRNLSATRCRASSKNFQEGGSGDSQGSRPYRPLTLSCTSVDDPDKHSCALWSHSQKCTHLQGVLALGGLEAVKPRLLSRAPSTKPTRLQHGLPSLSRGCSALKLYRGLDKGSKWPTVSLEASHLPSSLRTGLAPAASWSCRLSKAPAARCNTTAQVTA